MAAPPSSADSNSKACPKRAPTAGSARTASAVTSAPIPSPARTAINAFTLVSCPTNNSLAAPRLFALGGVAPPRHSAHYASSARLARHENPRADRASYWWDRTLARRFVTFDIGQLTAQVAELIDTVQ